MTATATETSLLATEANQTTGQDESKDQSAPAKDTQATAPEQTQETEKSKEKPAETKSLVGDDTKPDDAKKPEGAPETYVEFDVPKGLPEGHELDQQVLGEFSTVARELNLTQGNAQKLLDKVLPAIHASAMSKQSALMSQWNEAVRTDKEIGGQKLDENLAAAKRAVTDAAFGNKALRDLLNGPFGAHPEVVRFLVKVGRKVSPDTFVGGSRDRSPVDLNDPDAQAERMYPDPK